MRLHRQSRTVIAMGVLFALTVLAQGRRQGGRGGGVRPGNTSGPSEAVQSAVVHFEGTLRNFDKKTILLDRDDGQSIVFRRTKSTAFIRSGDHSGFDLGIKVQVEAHRDRVGDLDALRVCEGTCPGR